MKKGTPVSWKITAGTFAPRGKGVTICEEQDGHILVAVDSLQAEHPPLGYHPVIYCAVTWLTDETPAPAPVTPAPAPAEAPAQP